MWIINGQVINRQRNFTDGNGNRQRGSILVQWTKAALAEIGVKPFREVQFNQKWYKSTGFTDTEEDGEVVRTHTTTPRYTLAEAKAELIKELNAQAYQLLLKTDFYVIRKMDTDVAIPTDVKTERNGIRNDIVSNETAINALSDYSDVVDYSITWTQTPSSSSSTSSSSSSS